jgi:uncharacterized protein
MVVASPALAQTIPPPPQGQWVVDETHRLSPATLVALNAVATRLDVGGRGQLGVLVVDTCGAVPSRSFATRVFNAWGIGHAATNDGVMLFAALGDRKAEIVLGTGAHLTTAQTDQVMRDAVVANFKKGDPDGAMLAGARALAALLGTATEVAPATPTRPSDPATQTLRERATRLVRGEEVFPDASPRHWVVDLSDVLSASATATLDRISDDVYAESRGRLFFLVVKDLDGWPGLGPLAARLRSQHAPARSIPLAVVAADVQRGEAVILVPPEYLRTPWEEQQVRAAETAMQRVRSDRLGALVTGGHFARDVLLHGPPPRPMDDVLREGFARYSWLFPGTGAIALLGLVFGTRRYLRYRARDCVHCHRPMQRLGEAEDDAYLDGAQRTEESIGSVDYDVWHCGACDAVIVLDYSRWFSGYHRCPECRARTLRSSSTTLQSATEWSEGLVQVDERCANCSHHHTYTRTTARLSSSSSSSWSSSSSSSSSFGGGSSSGSGSSGSW